MLTVPSGLVFGRTEATSNAGAAGCCAAGDAVTQQRTTNTDRLIALLPAISAPPNLRSVSPPSRSRGRRRGRVWIPTSDQAAPAAQYRSTVHHLRVFASLQA